MSNVKMSNHQVNKLRTTKNKLNNKETLVKHSHEVVPLKQRRQVSSKGQILNVTAICNYKSIEVFRKD